MAEREITVTMSKSEALALERIAQLGLKAAEAFNLIPHPQTAESGMRKLGTAAHEIDVRRPPAGMTYTPRAKPARPSGRGAR